MIDTEKTAKILRLIETAEAALKSARELLGDAPEARHISSPLIRSEEPTQIEKGETQIIEGPFDGQNMMGPGGKIYPVPANYASKSKLVEGDRLKLTVLPNGSFVYKQISPVERTYVRGTLLKEDGQFRVAVEGKSYKVLLASVTYYKGNAGDEVTLILPKDKESQWGTLEAVLPQVSGVPAQEGESF